MGQQRTVTNGIPSGAATVLPLLSPRRRDQPQLREDSIANGDRLKHRRVVTAARDGCDGAGSVTLATLRSLCNVQVRKKEAVARAAGPYWELGLPNSLLSYVGSLIIGVR